MNNLKKRYLLVVAVGILSFALRMWMLDKHWINPDEGAHLMDAVLALNGKIPMIDYDSRQPLYTYSLAGILHLFGHDFASGRLLSFMCSFLTGVTVFFLGKVLFDEKTAVLGTIIYFLLPLEFMNSTMVKTEPLTTLLTSISFLTLSLSLRNDNDYWLIVSGVAAALCFYVRQSAIIILAAVVIVFISGIRSHCTGGRTKPLLLFFAGYFFTVFIVNGLYFSVAGFNQKIVAALNPFGFVYLTVKKGVYVLSGSIGLLRADSATQSAGQFPTKFPLYWRYIKDALGMHLFLIVGALYVFIGLVSKKISFFKNEYRDMRSSCVLLFVWIFLLAGAYAYFLYVKGFHIDYFREFLPPLTLLFAVWVRFSFMNHRGAGRAKSWMVAGVCILPCLIVLHALQPARFGLGTVTAVGMAVFTMIYYTPEESIKRKRLFLGSVLLLAALICIPGVFNLSTYLSGKTMRLILLTSVVLLPLLFMGKPPGRKTGIRRRSIAYTVMAGAIVFGISASVKVVNWAYTAPWPPKNVYDVAAMVKNRTSIEDRVMSGAVIWEIQSNRRPFLDITHPLALANKIEKSERKRIRQNLESNSPKVIILDGYTGKTYLRQFPWLKNYINSAYAMVHRSEGGKYPVEIYLKN